MDDHSHDVQLTEFADCTGGIYGGSAYESPPTSPTFSQSGHQHRYGHYDEIDQSHEDTQMLVYDGGYNSSGSSTRQFGDIMGGDLDDDLDRMSSRASSHSSVSSIPGSVLTMGDGMKAVIPDNTLPHHWEDQDSKVYSTLDGPVRSIPAIRHRETAFRKPSSVKAMQMHTEDEGDDFLTPPKRRGQRFSDVSMRSSGSSPLRKSQFYSPTGSAGKPKVKKEYPLVLLHCNLLPPSLPVPAMGYHSQKILREVLPSEYWRRWKLLEEKVGSGVLRERGVLISHPEDMYDLLEERLLESLELQRPRLDHGHFLGRDENDSERDDQSVKEESATDEEEGEDCPDCGGRVVRHNNAGRKWEIKVFAANGLMRAGAWAAAWKEMEKVDVEVGLWLPSEVRRELERRLLEEEIYHLENRLQVPSQELEHGTAEVRQHSPQTPPRAIEEQTPFVPEEAERPPPIPEKAAAQEQRMPEHAYVPRSSDDIDLQTLLVNYLRVLASDRRNVAIAVLSFLVVFFAIHATPQADQSALRPFPQDILESASISSFAVTAMHSSTTSWDKPTSCALPSVETPRAMPPFPSSSSDILASSVAAVSSPLVASEGILRPVLEDSPKPQAEPETSSSVQGPLAVYDPEPEISLVEMKDPEPLGFSLELLALTQPMSPAVKGAVDPEANE
ncbi:uncharacterized protein BO80DRAFT_345588 [Aspergillus ibericus CBS 121593]|uniref:Flavoprotein oxygenase n=1 Tax=Aspergillus ibericus CBS 121593 TaxID=1448316 RepID=A0A395HDX8_9EURO|nr:hypothetical protein BO80DRAFT_345588 [Aspergillus ibericus CBS 121593]RAL05198.1 hypothetical protein BO80DRAFT_345588 [Aspergillus ibericus CBS 121593]